jgi:hypothetical protein
VNERFADYTETFGIPVGAPTAAARTRLAK